MACREAVAAFVKETTGKDGRVVLASAAASFGSLFGLKISAEPWVLLATPSYPYPFIHVYVCR